MTFLLLVASIAAREPAPATEAGEALRMLAEGRPAAAVAALDSLSARMPHNHRLAADLAAALFADSAAAASDSVLEAVRSGDAYLEMPADTLASARTAASLAAAMASGDYRGVASAADTLRSLLAERGDPTGVDATNLEAALRWLEDHDPPPPQEGGGEGSGDREQEEDDQGEDSPETDGDNGRRRPPDRQEDPSPEESGGEEVPPVPREMTPDMARRILDMVEEAAPGDTLKAGAAGGRLSW